MGGLRKLARAVARMPRGYAADGRMLGLVTAAAVESAARQDESVEQEQSTPLPRQRQRVD
ncbi:hypothetical protein GCM10027271_36520 [Saccharopolyspora gloriosae]|uniref:F0F1-type ATP synthase membrane subunit c/vacuolar-type H+-ATPase subunit K n=1 Tax=Saccharopolyspora gloriosae TaxID=455344 RepID=A0A840NCX0_9PSEU|nr:hypothetical protein [Saccharopolyspora gloriosae]MBB5069454.1 F0F1-type ATP synthase membrane subunit c/vacuolar-type H+-ATPase subunit K [Saccharopolyspora gloriosae]